MYLADQVYGYVYNNNSNSRNKTQFAIKTKNKQYDYVFLGSSRVQNHVNTELLSQLTGKKSINMGTNGALLTDNVILLKLLAENNQIKNLWLQIDYVYNSDKMSEIVGTEVLPYLNVNEIVNMHVKNNNDNYLLYKYIPFYKYMHAEHNIGIREFIFNAIAKKNKINLEIGFDPKNQKFNNNKINLPNNIATSNKALKEIQEICKNKQINLVLFTAPFAPCTKNLEYIDKLKNAYPELKDYSRIYTDSEKYFIDCGHLNEYGANEFTKIIAQDLKQ